MKMAADLWGQKRLGNSTDKSYKNGAVFDSFCL